MCVYTRVALRLPCTSCCLFIFAVLLYSRDEQYTSPLPVCLLEDVQACKEGLSTESCPGSSGGYEVISRLRRVSGNGHQPLARDVGKRVALRPDCLLISPWPVWQLSKGRSELGERRGRAIQAWPSCRLPVTTVLSG